MRLWSIHPQYLDSAGLLALWREGLLAQAVLSGLTRGYRHHPQLMRFRQQEDAVASIASYLSAVADEATRRGYTFDRAKLRASGAVVPIEVTKGQLLFEWEHLREKLRRRNAVRYREVALIAVPLPHPLFVVVPGPVAEWERDDGADRQRRVVRRKSQ